ncbi:MAG: hypothetical protein JWO89_2106 [Verrucomicrobiaceae bacterium]|nr:hypothetical protein [Verrucomicrobiaceae bacterium]
MRRAYLFTSAFSLAIASPSQGEEKITYADHARAVLENKCFSCHNPDKKKGDLDLTSYAGTMAGGGGGAIVDPGNPSGSKLINTITKKDEPFMPPEGAPLPAKDIELLQKWIAGGVLDTASSVAKKSSKPKVDLNVASGTGKPTGPIARPQDVLLEPVVVTPHTTAVTAMAASPWTSLVAFASPKQVLLYDTDTKQLAGVFPYVEGYGRSLKFSRSGSLLVMGGGRGGKMGQAVVWDVKTGKRVAEIGKEFDSVMSADITPDHSKVVIGSPSKKVKVFDVATGEELYTISKHTDWVLATQFSPDGILLATADRNGNVFVWEAANGGEFFLLGQHKAGACTDVSWRSDSNVLASCSRDGSIILWEMNEGKQLKTWTAHGSGVESVSFTPDGKLLSCGQDGAVALWDINGTKLADLPNQGDVATKVTALADGKTCAVANWRGEVKLLNFEKKAEYGALTSNPAKIDQRIVQTEQRIGELNGKIKPSQDAVAKADADAKTLDAALAKLKGDAAANDARKNALPNEIKATEAQLAAARAQREKLGKDKDIRIGEIQQFNKRQEKIKDLEKQLAGVAAEAAKAATADQALTALKGQLEAAKKQLVSKPGDAAMQASVKDVEAKVAAAAAAQAKLAPVKQQADQWAASLAQLKKEAGSAPAPAADLDKAIVEAETKIKATKELLVAKNAEVPNVDKAGKNYPAVIKDAEAKAAKGHEALVAAQAAAKAVTDELALAQKLVPSLKAAQFNVGLLSEKDALAKLESDLQAYTDAVKDNEEGKIAAAKRIEDSKKSIADAIAAIPGLEAASAKQTLELEPFEKSFTAVKAANDAAAAKVAEQKQALAAKEAEAAALAKAKDDGIAAAKAAVDALNKELPAHRKAVADATAKLAAPAKLVDERKATVAKLINEVAQAKEAETAANTLATQKDAELKTLEEAYVKTRADGEAAQKELPLKKQAAEQAQAKAQTAKNSMTAAEKALAAAKQANKPEAADIEKSLVDLRAKLTAAEAETAASKTALQAIEARNSAVVAAQQVLAAARIAATKTKQGLTNAQALSATKLRNLEEGAKKQANAEKSAAPMVAAHKTASDKLAGAQKALTEKQAAPAALQKDFEAKVAPVNAAIAQIKQALVPLEKALADATAKTAAEQKPLDAKRAEVGKAQQAVTDTKGRKEQSEKTIAAATKEIPEREKNLAEAKAELAKLQPLLEPQRTKVKQMTERYVALLPK